MYISGASNSQHPFSDVEWPGYWLPVESFHITSIHKYRLRNSSMLYHEFFSSFWTSFFSSADLVSIHSKMASSTPSADDYNGEQYWDFFNCRANTRKPAGSGIVIACWVITGIVGLVLIARFLVKGWIHLTLPRLGSTERVWGVEDIFFLCGFILDIAHMGCIQKGSVESAASWSKETLPLSWQNKWMNRSDSGLGRHSQFLSSSDKTMALKYCFYSQPLGRGYIPPDRSFVADLTVFPAIAATLFSRTGIMWFIYTCLSNDRAAKMTVIPCIAIQFTVSVIALFDFVTQCGLNPAHAVGACLWCSRAKRRANHLSYLRQTE